MSCSFINTDSTLSCDGTFVIDSTVISSVLPPYGVARYWVPPFPATWSDTNHWSLVSGGASGAALPGPNNVVVFNSGGIGSCTFDTTVNIKGLYLYSSYLGTVSQNSYPITIDSSGAFFEGGIFNGNTNNININGNFHVAGDYTHNNGTVIIDSTNAYFDSLNVNFKNLKIDASNLSFINNCNTNDLYLNSGNIESIDATLSIKNSFYITENYSQWDKNTLALKMDNTSDQIIYYSTGNIIPSLIVDKTTTVYCNGTGPIIIRKDFIILDGTFNSNNKSIKVGVQ